MIRKQEERYRFVYRRKSELKTRGREVVLVIGRDNDASFTFQPDDFALASLFDGERDFAAVLDEFYQGKGVRLQKADLSDFVITLKDGGFLISDAEIDAAKTAQPLDSHEEDAEWEEVPAHAVAVIPATRGPNRRGRQATTGEDGRLLTGIAGPAARRSMGDTGQALPRIPPKGRASKHRHIKWLLVLLVLALLGLVPYTYEPGGEIVIMPGQKTDVRALVAGDIREIFVEDGEFVAQGQILARLASDEEESRLAGIEARLIELNARLEIAQQGATAEEVALAKQQVQTASTRSNFSRERAERLAELIARNVIAQQEYDDALAKSEVDREQLEEKRRALDRLLSGSRPEEIRVIEAEILEEVSQREYQQTQLGYTDMRAGISGQVASGSLKYAVGDFLKRGELLLTIQQSHIVLAEIRIPESDIAEVNIGSPVRLKAWAYPEREFSGTVASIAPNAEAGDFGKVVRVLSRIPNEDGELKPEMSGHAKIQGSTQPAALAFTRMLRRFFLVEMWSWLP